MNEKHLTKQFACGDASLNEWLQKRALKNQKSGASRTFVIAENRLIIGYYAIATGSVERIHSPKSIARNMPEPIPVLILARLAIDRLQQGKRLGSSLLKDALLRTCAVSQNVGIRALLVHAISDDAKAFYKLYGFIESPSDPMTLLLSIKHIEQHI